jgi:radical SAM superfamily enzyme YgiQ (UPF0313 family)
VENASEHDHCPRIFGELVSPLRRSIYLINPAEKAPGYHSVEVLAHWRLARAVNAADLTMPTVAALVPPDWHVSICDERVQAVDFNTTAAVVGLTGKVSQRGRMIELAQEFKRRGKLVVMGGPYGSLNPDDLQPHTDILVTGELEEIAGKLFSDIAGGCWQPHYEGTRPDLTISPVPRWDLYPHNVALAAQVQTSRGCPFECEFCDVIQYLGRRQRWKAPEQVIRELDVLYGYGYRNIFFADDNFTVMRRRARELVESVSAWNASRTAGRVNFSTQLSIDIARDPELMAQCVEAGVRMVFIGVETPNRESLAETMKRQNLRIDLSAEIHKVVHAGMMVLCGMVVGFDHDGPDIFERQAAFIESIPVPVIQMSVLVAPPATPLYARLKEEGRLVGAAWVGAADFLASNIVPKLMTDAQRSIGVRWLMNRIYTPQAFGRRVRKFVEASIVRHAAPRVSMLTGLEGEIARRVAQLGPAERTLVEQIVASGWQRPDLHTHMSYILLFYGQVRHLMEINGLWDPSLLEREVAIAG